MNCITFSFYKSYYYFIIFWIASFLISFSISSFDNKNKKSQEYNRNEEVTKQIINLICQITGDLLAGFLVLYTYLTSSNVIINEKESNIIKLNNKKPSKQINRCTLILLVSIIEFSFRSINPIFSLFYKRLEIGEFMWLFFVIVLSRIFFSGYLLNIKLKKHHFISLSLFLTGYFFMFILAFSAGDIHLEKWPYLSFTIIRYILQGLEDVLNKLLLTEKYLLPHLLMFLRGLYNSGMAIIFLIIMKCSGFEFVFSSVLSDNLLFFFFFFFFYFFYYLLTMQVSYTFTPQHLSFLNIVYYMFQILIYRIINDYSLVIIICEAIDFLFMIFSTLLFSEMIIINKWGLNENTKRELLIKEKLETDDEKSNFELITDKEDNK